MAEELGISYKLNPIGPRTGETQTKEFTSINRKQKIPLMQIGEFYLSESLAICKYLQRAFPSKRLFIPTSDEELAKEDEWCCFILSEIDETSLYVMRRHYDLKEIYGESKTVTNACRDYLKRQFDVIEEYLEDKNYIMKEGFGICDIFLISCLDWAIFYEFELTKNMTQYRDDIINRPAYKKAMDINYSR
tara:strand:- start:161 stop:730 length:570 start_codon:yes stop_codon:yes gene_type:complete